MASTPCQFQLVKVNFELVDENIPKNQCCPVNVNTCHMHVNDYVICVLVLHAHCKMSSEDFYALNKHK